ncbi:MAG: tetratricopeptide repeat protein [Desulfobulbales bacterium]|nr:tetratricopeptide repeat protein [Desulfobulbales bacterium]
MSTQSFFSKKDIQAQQPDTPRGLLEELNLPPGMITAIRNNKTQIQIGLICIVVLVLGWIYYDYHTEMQDRKGASLLASGLQVEAADERVRALENVIEEYGGTDAARWSKLELAHIANSEGRFEEAVAKYKEVLDALSADNPLVPLTRLNLAQSYEQAGQYDQAIAQYKTLKDSTGFAQQAYMGLGRLYMEKQDTVQAHKVYTELLSSLKDATTPDPGLTARLEAKIAALDAEKPAAPSPAENN